MTARMETLPANPWKADRFALCGISEWKHQKQNTTQNTL